MSSRDLTDVLERVEHPEATVLRVCVRSIVETEQMNGFKEALYREAESAAVPLVLDLSAVEFLSSATLGWFITTRRKLVLRGMPFQAPCRRHGALFAIFRDAATALQAIRQGQSDPLMFCGVGKEIMEVFVVC